MFSTHLTNVLSIDNKRDIALSYLLINILLIFCKVNNFRLKKPQISIEK